jgi:hypothetical protein
MVIQFYASITKPSQNSDIFKEIFVNVKLPATKFMEQRCILILFVMIYSFAAFGCASKNAVNPQLSNEMPPQILWAWERPEDLRFLDANKFGVAFLAQTLVLQNDEIIYKPRRQPLEIAPNVYAIAVTRIETSKLGGRRPAFSAQQQTKIVELIKQTLERPNVRHVQIDFDAVASERKFYGALMNELKTVLPENTPLTMTSLASWCVGDAWFNDFPVDEAVPMVFEMGADAEKIRSFLSNGNDWREPLCRGSYGFSVDEPLNIKLEPNRRVYYFKSSAWNKSDLEKLK